MSRYKVRFINSGVRSIDVSYLSYYKDNKLHRIDGPAICIGCDYIHRVLYINGKKVVVIPSHGAQCILEGNCGKV
jgi:hypothetical protein